MVASAFDSFQRTQPTWDERNSPRCFRAQPCSAAVANIQKFYVRDGFRKIVYFFFEHFIAYRRIASCQLPCLFLSLHRPPRFSSSFISTESPIFRRFFFGLAYFFPPPIVFLRGRFALFIPLPIFGFRPWSVFEYWFIALPDMVLLSSRFFGSFFCFFLFLTAFSKAVALVSCSLPAAWLRSCPLHESPFSFYGTTRTFSPPLFSFPLFSLLWPPGVIFPWFFSRHPAPRCPISYLLSFFLFPIIVNHLLLSGVVVTP